MAIDLNRIEIPGNEEGSRNKEHGNGGINMNAIPVREEPPRERRGGRINLFGLFDPNRRRAEIAAQEARLDALREQEQRQRKQAMEAARQQIRDLSGGPERTSRLPDIGMGARPALARLAQTNPERAMSIAQKIVNRAKAHNDDVMAAQEEAEAARAQVQQNQQALNARPIATTRVDLTRISLLKDTPDAPTVINIARKGTRGVLGLASAALTLTAKSAIAAASGKPKNMFDAIQADGAGLHADAPLSDVTHTDIGTKLSDFDITANPPSWLDKIVGAASSLPGINRQSVLGWVPFGTITVRERKSGKVLAEAPTLLPGRREQELKAAAGRIRMPAEPALQFVPEPTVADVLGDAVADILAQERGTGVEGRDYNRPYHAPGYTPMPR